MQLSEIQSSAKMIPLNKMAKILDSWAPSGWEGEGQAERHALPWISKFN